MNERIIEVSTEEEFRSALLADCEIVRITKDIEITGESMTTDKRIELPTPSTLERVLKKLPPGTLFELQETFEFILKKMGFRLEESCFGDEYEIFKAYEIFKDDDLLAESEAETAEDGEAAASFIWACIWAIDELNCREEKAKE